MITIKVDIEHVPRLVKMLASLQPPTEQTADAVAQMNAIRQLEQIGGGAKEIAEMKAVASRIRPGVDAQLVIEALANDVRDLLVLIGEDEPRSLPPFAVDGYREWFIELRAVAKRIGDRLGEEGP